TLPVRRRAAFTIASTEYDGCAVWTCWKFRRRIFRPLTILCSTQPERPGTYEGTHHDAPAARCGKLVRRPPASERDALADDATPHSPWGGRSDGLVVRLRQRVTHPPSHSDLDRHRSGDGLRAVGRQSV